MMFLGKKFHHCEQENRIFERNYWMYQKIAAVMAFITGMSFSVSHGMDDERMQIVEKQDKAYRQSLLGDVEKDFTHMKSRFSNEMNTLTAYLQEIDALEKTISNDTERNKKYNNRPFNIEMQHSERNHLT